MAQLPGYISVLFILTTLLTVLLLHRASAYNKYLTGTIFIWLAIQTVIGLSGFYTVTYTTPPRFGLLLLPPLIAITILFLTKKGNNFLNKFDAKTLTLLHTVRVLVELTLYFLYLHKVVPQIMTFEGRNFDILCGISAPFIYYFGYLKNKLNKYILIGWNIVCLLLLTNIVVIALLSAPFPFQKFAFGQPNIAILYFPYIWLPCCVVPIVLLAHLASLKNLFKK